MKKLITLLLLTSQFLLFASPTLAAMTNYSYDSNGNMESDGETCYEYNEANRLSKVKDCSTGQLQAEYLYDDTGDRGIKKLYNNGQLVETVYSRNQFFETKVDAQGGEENTSYYYIDGRLIAKKNTDGSVKYIHRDHLGSSTVVTDDQGTLIEESEYYPYGQLKAGGYEVKFGYTGQEKDWEGNQLNYYGARYYDAQLGRFTQPDTMLPDPYDPQQLNRYAYVRNNPLKYIDPTGNYIQLVTVALQYAAMYATLAWNAFGPLGQQLFAANISESVPNAVSDPSIGTIAGAGLDIADIAPVPIFGAVNDVANSKTLGKWIDVAENMSENAAKYQTHVTGKPHTMSYLVDGVKFDGIIDDVLVDAKSGYNNFVSSNTGDFQKWFSGADSLLEQADRQIRAANGTKIEWHFQIDDVKNAVQKLFEKEGVSGIDLIYNSK